MIQMHPDSINGFPKWLATAKRGDQFCYYQGKTPETRYIEFIKPAHAAESRLVSLVQMKRKVVKETHRGPVNEYFYIAQKR